MTDPNSFTDIDFGGPATYRIVVQGTVNERWIDRLGGMDVSTFHPEGGSPRTILTGRICDQADLNGVLETLYGLHLSILKVEKIEQAIRGPVQSTD
jgi:hypothetical protein